MTHPRIYALLKSAGHSPFKAAEIILDATRRQEHAIIWVRIIFAARRRAGKAV